MRADDLSGKVYHIGDSVVITNSSTQGQAVHGIVTHVTKYAAYFAYRDSTGRERLGEIRLQESVEGQSMTVAELRRVLADLPGDLPVRRHDTEWAAVNVTSGRVAWGIPDNYMVWVYETEAECRDMMEDGETPQAFCLIR